MATSQLRSFEGEAEEERINPLAKMAVFLGATIAIVQTLSGLENVGITVGHLFMDVARYLA